MRVYKNKEELKGEIKKTYEKYILEFDSIPEDFKDKSGQNSCRKSCLSSGVDNFNFKVGK